MNPLVPRTFFFLPTLAALGILLAIASGCADDAYCFDNCDGQQGNPGASSGNNMGGAGGLFPAGSGTGTGTGGAGGACSPTNGGVEQCDNVDNDCNGVVDDLSDADFQKPISCGICGNNCLAELINCDPTTITCTPSPNPGVDPGTCVCGQCATDWWDLNGDQICEYPCIKTGNDDTVCNNKDDDCDGFKDEDVNLCTSVTDCGKCGKNCVVLHGTPACVNNGQLPCTDFNTQCQIASCDCTPGDCWWDLDGLTITGCEYQCELTNGGIEICGDNLDNDCDGLIDQADDLSADPQIGQPCFGDPDGLCATAAHQGITACQQNQVVCTGANVLVENQTPETCNGVDDDCDGTVDDNPMGAGAPCGQSNIFPCSYGAFQCQGGALVCVGAVNPTTETCNGVDDDCDGNIDATGANPPADSVGQCNIPPPAPPGSMQVCQPGNKACVAGQVVCQGSIGPSGPTDACGADSNCDGLLTNQPNLMTDVNNCGSCGNNCYAGAVHSLWACNAGMCQFQGCEAGYYDLNGDQQCEYPCVFVQAQEACNGIDDNCNGQIDENIASVPSPVQVCGVSPSATRPECTSGVSVSCQAGNWQCTFPAGVCSPTCAGAAEICDTLDNNCNGLLNENVPNFGQPCASDDGLPPPGHGACRTTGTFVCNGPGATVCSAVKANCNTLPGGCTEVCDGIDNDCDALVDETFNNKGSDPTYFVKPTVTQTAANLWVYTYEASRPNATNSTQGSGNGYYCSGGSCVGVPSAPAGTTLDKTPACSVANRIPWFNVTPIEVEHTCQAMGGFVCTTANWINACSRQSACTWGYNPSGVPCTTSYTATKYCNLGPSFDFNGGVAGDQDGLLPTASSSLQNCWTSWIGLFGNIAPSDHLYDITGNLREITKSAANTYPLMGGAFNTAAESGATCSFQFYTVDQNFKLFDVGFRCCFSANPTL